MLSYTGWLRAVRTFFQVHARSRQEDAQEVELVARVRTVGEGVEAGNRVDGKRARPPTPFGI